VSPWWQQLLLVMAGGALGAAGRFALGDWLLRRLGDGFPWGTLAVNLIGSFLAGLLIVWLHSRGAAASVWRAFLLIGLLGGFTTYSALMIDCLLLGRVAPRPGLLAAYLAATLIGGIVLVLAGWKIGHVLRG
jgi:CrcB protein